MSSGPSFEADLRAVREARALTLDEIQQETRFPVDVLARFERGELLGDPTFNDVYLRAFLKAYAKAVGLPPAIVLDGFAAYRGGSYQGLQQPSDVETPMADAPPVLRASRPPSAPRSPEGPPASAAAPSGAADSAAPAAAPDAAAPLDPPPPAASATPPAVAALSAVTERPVAAPPAAPPRARVERPPVPGASRSFDKNWGTILGLTAAVVLVIAALLYFLVFRDAGPAERRPAEQAGTVAPQEDAPPVDAPRFTLPIAVTVAASGDGLQWFRTETDGGTRTPSWIDAASEQTFRADSSLVLYGEGTQAGGTGGWADATLTLQGLSWRPAEGTTVRIDPRRGQALLDSLARVQGQALPSAAVADPAPDPAP